MKKGRQLRRRKTTLEKSRREAVKSDFREASFNQVKKGGEEENSSPERIYFIEGADSLPDSKRIRKKGGGPSPLGASKGCLYQP